LKTCPDEEGIKTNTWILSILKAVSL